MYFSKSSHRILRTNDSSMRIRSCYRDRKFNFERSDFFSFFKRGSNFAQSLKLTSVTASVRDSSVRSVLICQRGKLSKTVRLILTRLIFYRDSRFVKARERNLRGMQTPRVKLFPSLSIFLEAHFSRASRYYLKRTEVKICVMRVVHKGAHNRTILIYGNISMKVTNAKSTGVEG